MSQDKRNTIRMSEELDARLREKAGDQDFASWCREQLQMIADGEMVPKGAALPQMLAANPTPAAKKFQLLPPPDERLAAKPPLTKQWFEEARARNEAKLAAKKTQTPE